MRDKEINCRTTTEDCPSNSFFVKKKAGRQRTDLVLCIVNDGTVKKLLE